MLPHPRAAERAFVLLPWPEIDPAAVLPGRGPVADLLAGPGHHRHPAGRPVADDDRRLGFTRARDLLVVAGVALVAGLSAGPDRLRVAAGVPAAGRHLRGRARDRRGARRVHIRARLQAAGRSAGSGAELPRSSVWGELQPLPPLVGARALMVAKASSLAGAGLAGLWAGLLLYVVPLAGSVSAAGRDSITAIVGHRVARWS